MFAEYDIFKLKKMIPGENLEIGMIGVVLIVHTKPSIAYEVEFVNPGGTTRALLTLTEEYMECCDSETDTGTSDQRHSKDNK